MAFKSEVLKKIADEKFDGVQGLHVALIRDGVNININTLNDWCYNHNANPRVNQLNDVINFLKKKKIAANDILN